MSGTPTGRSTEVECPFYRKDKGLVVSCEGITEDATLHMRFRSAAHKTRHMDVFCCGRYKNCEIYEAVMKAKYAEDL